MPLDNRKIHQYTETDQQANFSALLNLLAASTSNAIKYFSGTPAERAAFTPAPEGAVWQDTTGTKARYIGVGGVWVAEDTGWIAPTILNGTPHATYPPRYRRARNQIMLKGQWTPTSDNQTAFQVPLGFRPEEDTYFWVDRTQQVRCIFQADGQFRFVGPGGTGPLSLAGTPKLTVVPA